MTLAGTRRLRVADAPAQEMTPGSFALVPGGVVHAATCAPVSECIVYEELPGPADFILAKVDEKK
jgi:quercetin dioxygenase-like cupin family protein